MIHLPGVTLPQGERQNSRDDSFKMVLPKLLAEVQSTSKAGLRWLSCSHSFMASLKASVNSLTTSLFLCRVSLHTLTSTQSLFLCTPAILSPRGFVSTILDSSQTGWGGGRYLDFHIGQTPPPSAHTTLHFRHVAHLFCR